MTPTVEAVCGDFASMKVSADNDMKAVGIRLTTIESRMELEGLRIDTLENIVDDILKPRASISSSDVEAEVRKQLQAMHPTQLGKPWGTMHESDKRAHTAVIG